MKYYFELVMAVIHGPGTFRESYKVEGNKGRQETHYKDTQGFWPLIQRDGRNKHKLGDSGKICPGRRCPCFLWKARQVWETRHSLIKVCSWCESKGEKEIRTAQILMKV